MNQAHTAKLNELLEEVAIRTRRLQIHNLHGVKLQEDLERAITDLQAVCPHEWYEETSTYTPGGYDYTGETFYTHTCTTCKKITEQWSVSDGRYG